MVYSTAPSQIEDIVPKATVARQCPQVMNRPKKACNNPKTWNYSHKKVVLPVYARHIKSNMLRERVQKGT